MATSSVWLVLRVAIWAAFALFGAWLGIVIKTYWLIAVSIGIALLGGALELKSKKGSRLTLIQAGIVTAGLCALAIMAAIFGIVAIVDESQGVAHRPWRRSSGVIYDVASEALGSAGGVLFWLLCFGGFLVVAIRYVRKLVGKEKPDAT